MIMFVFFDMEITVPVEQRRTDGRTHRLLEPNLKNRYWIGFDKYRLPLQTKSKYKRRRHQNRWQPPPTAQAFGPIWLI